MNTVNHLRLEVPEHLQATAAAAVSHNLPDAQLGRGPALALQLRRESTGWHCRASFVGAVWEYMDEDIAEAHYSEDDWRRREKELARLGVMRVLEKARGLQPKPWGILTGVRPTKMVHNMWDRGFTPSYMDTLLRNIYGVAPQRRTWVLDVARRQRPFFPQDPNSAVSVYIGVPFCPTRCGYCSFAAYPLATHGHLLEPFLQGLVREIAAVGTFLRHHGTQVHTVYVGGGTPTVLQGAQLQQLLDTIGEQLPLEACVEYTVEAGRPETLSEDTVRRLHGAGVGRISINPQTMRQTTLERVGRNHTPEDVEVAFARVRSQGIPLINADIILGLPGESLVDVECTLERLEQLAPDHLTVHTLAWKRAAQWHKQAENAAVQRHFGPAMVELARSTAHRWGMVPYYLYRQRDIVGGLENIGYARPGTESLYNIFMMEEKQTVFGIGAGAITKFVTAAGHVSRVANPKCPATYRQDVDALVEQKNTRFRQLLNV